MKISELFNTIKKTAGSSDKSAIMQANINDTIKQIFEDTYDNSKKYYVKKFNKELSEGIKTVDNNYPEFRKVLNILSGRVVTGNAAIELVESVLAEFTKESQEILCSILDRNLKIGLSTETFSKLLGKEAPEKFEVTLAYNLDKVNNVNPIDGTYYASRKMDGARDLNIVSKKNDKCSIKFLSRQNKEFTTLNNLIPALEWLVRDLPDDTYVFDGELCIVDENGDEHFDWVMKEIKRKDHTIENPCYQIFDFCTLDEFNGIKKTGNFTERYKTLKNLFKGNKFSTIKLLEQELITSQEDFDRWTKYAEVGNWEGFMLRKDVPFETGRTKNLLKVKKFQDAEFIVKDIDIGTMTTAEPGKGNVSYEGVRALLIDYKGNTVHVGTGLSKEQRIAWHKNPSDIIGKTITVKYFQTSKNQNGEESLRFPILKYVYENERDC